MSAGYDPPCTCGHICSAHTVEPDFGCVLMACTCPEFVEHRPNP